MDEKIKDRRCLQERIEEIGPIAELATTTFDALKTKEQMEEIAQWKVEDLFQYSSADWKELIDITKKSKQGSCKEDTYEVLAYKIHKMLVDEDLQEKEYGGNALTLLASGLLKVYHEIKKT